MHVLLSFLLAFVTATSVFAGGFTGGGGGLVLSDATSCPANVTTAIFLQQCVDRDNGTEWTCTNPSAGGASPTLCDDAGDWINSSSSSSSGVSTFESRTGTVISVAGDYTATEITNTPAGAVAAITVQAAITELDAEKSALAHTHTSSTISALDISADTNLAVTTPIVITDDTLSCPTCVTAAAALTSGQLIAGAGLQAQAVTDLIGDVTTGGSVTTTIADNSVDGTDIEVAANVQGDILYYDGVDWVRLAAGTSGLFLQTQGVAANPQWATPAGAGDFSSSTASSVDSELVLFDGPAGKTGKRAAGTGVARTAVGVYSASELSGDATTSGSNVVTVVDDLHNHTTTSISGLDISADTNFAVTAPIVLTGDTVSCPTCTTSAAALTSGQLVAGAGLQAQAVTNLTGEVTTAGGVATSIADNVVDGTEIALGSDAQGDIMYYSGTDWVRLAAGTNGLFLQTQGVGANPQWTTPAGGGDLSSNTATAVDSEFVLFSGTTGKLSKRATGTGVTRATSGVYSAAELSGDATTTGSNVVTVVDDLHDHTTTSVSGLDISADTNLTGSAPIVLTGDAVTCPTCTTSAAALTSGQLIAGAGLQAQAVTNLTGDVTTAGGVTTTIADNAVDGTDIAVGADAQGDILYYDGTNWVRLAAGADGLFLQTQGVGANPQWTTPAGGGDLSSNTATAVDSEIILFSGTTGKLSKRATGTGLARVASGVFSAAELSGDATTSGSNVVIVVDDSHLHTSSSLSGIDISADTNLTGTAPIVVTGDAATCPTCVTSGAALVSGRLVAGAGLQASISTDLTGDVTTAGGVATTIADNSVDGTDIAIGSDAQGDVLYYDGTNWVRLAAGTSGLFLQTQGAGLNPQWATPTGTGDFSSNTATSVDSEIVLFSGTAGKTGKRATGTGLARVTSGVLSAAELSGDATTSASNVVAVVDDSHAHTSTTVSGLDISADTNLAVTAPIVLTGDTVSLAANGVTATHIDETTNYVWTGVHSFAGGSLFHGGVNTQVGTTYTVLTSDENKLLTLSNASPVAVTLPQATVAGFTNGAVFHVFNRGAGTVTITPTTSTLNGAATLVLLQSQGAEIVSDGTNYSAWVSSASTGSGTVTNLTADTQRFTVATSTTTPALTTKAVNAIGTITTTATVNWANGVVQSATLTGDVTLSFSNPVNGQAYVLLLTQDATGGWEVVWPTISWVNDDVLPVMPAAPGATARFDFIYNGVEYVAVNPRPFTDTDTDQQNMQSVYNNGKQVIFLGSGDTNGVVYCRDVDENLSCSLTGVGGDRGVVCYDDGALGYTCKTFPDGETVIDSPSPFDTVFRVGGGIAMYLDGATQDLSFSGGGAPLKFVEAQGHEFGACTYSESALLVNNKPITGYFTCTSATTDGFDFDFYLENSWDLGTVAVRLCAAPTAASTANVVLGCSGQVVSDDVVVANRTTTNEQNVTITFSAQYEEECATTPAITLNGTKVGGAHIYMHCDIQSATATMANVRINAIPRTYYTVLKLSE